MSLIDPSGLDCIYYGKDANGDVLVAVQPGDCASDTDSGYYVDGTVTSVILYANGDLGFGFVNNDEGTGGGGVISDFTSGDVAFTTDPFAYSLGLQQQNYFNYMQSTFGSQTSASLTAAVAKGTSLAGHAIPTVCGVGVFTFGGAGGNKGGAGVLFELDSSRGFSVNGFGEGQNPTNGAGGGVFSNGKNGANPFVFIPTSEATGIVAFKGGIGGYVGGEYGIFEGGFGAYVNITSVSGCH